MMLGSYSWRLQKLGMAIVPEVRRDGRSDPPPHQLFALAQSGAVRAAYALGRKLQMAYFSLLCASVRTVCPKVCL